MELSASPSTSARRTKNTGGPRSAMVANTNVVAITMNSMPAGPAATRAALSRRKSAYTAPSPIAIPLRPNASQNASQPATKRSEEHTSELQSQSNLVCRLLLEKKKKNTKKNIKQAMH